MLKKLAHQLIALRIENEVSAASLAEQSSVDRATLKAIESGAGNIASLSAVATGLAHSLSPLPSALANKRRWLGIGSRSLAQAAGLSRPTVQAIERTGAGRVTSYEAMCAALNEPALLRGIEETWCVDRHTHLPPFGAQN